MLKLRDLPDETKVFCGHEYTAANIKFALSVDKGNTALLARAEQAAKQLAAGEPTIPTTIGEEKQTNPFLRADDPALAAAIGMAVVSTLFGRTTGVPSRSAWNCINGSLRDAPPSTRSSFSPRPLSFSMHAMRSAD